MLFHIKNINREYITALGTSFILLGMQTGNFIRSLFGVELVNLFMVLGLLSLTNFKNIFKVKFPLLFGLMNLVFLSQIIIIVYAVVAGGSNNELMSFIFLFYSIAIILAVSSNDERVFLKLPLVAYIFSSISVFLGLCVLTKGFTGIYLGDDLYYLRSETEQDGRSMIFLYGSTAIVHIIASCSMFRFIKGKGFLWQIITGILLLGDMFLLFVAGKRTVLLSSILVVLYFIWNQRIKIGSVFIKVVFVVVLLISSFSATIDYDFLLSFLGNVFESMGSGLGTLFGIHDAVFDESASIRVALRQWAFDTMENDFTIVNYIIGYGYMTEYLDQPILQCYFDMGLLGLFSYAFIMIVLPIRFLLNRNNDMTLLFFKLYSIQGVIGCLTGGLPYGYRLYMSSIFLFAAYNAQLKIKKMRTI